MSPQPSGGKMGFEFELGKRVQAQRIDDETPFRLLVLADFSGRSSRGLVEPISGRRPINVDVDNLDALPAKLGTTIHIPLGVGDSHMAIAIRSLDDFHPDHLAANIETFRVLKQIRMALANPGTFELAAQQVRALAGMTEQAAPAPSTSSAPSSVVSDNEFEQLLGKAPAKIQQPEKKHVDISAMVGELVREYVVPNPKPEQQELIRVVTDAMGVQLRAILHNVAFQQVEASWRGLAFLISRLELDDQLKVSILDVSRDELIADLSTEDLSKSSLYKLLVEQTVGSQGGQPWAAIVGDYSFGPSQNDVALLARLGTIAQAAGAPFLAAADASLMGCKDLSQTPDPDNWKQPTDLSLWDKLREMAVAPSIGLAWPRMLLRLPYGKGLESIDAFDFDETAQNFSHQQYLWGNPAFACGYCLASAFREYGWSLQPGGFMEIDDLPAHSRKIDGEKQVQSPAEAYLSDRAAGIIQGKGVIPLLAIKGRNAARFAGFSSIAQPSAPLAGQWT